TCTVLSAGVSARPAARFSPHAQLSKVRRDQFVGSLASPREHLGGGPVDQVPVRVESIQKTRFVLHWSGVDLLKRFNSHEKRAFDRTHIPPEPHRVASHIVAPALVGKNQIHRSRSLVAIHSSVGGTATPDAAKNASRDVPTAGPDVGPVGSIKSLSGTIRSWISSRLLTR